MQIHTYDHYLPIGGTEAPCVVHYTYSKESGVGIEKVTLQDDGARTFELQDELFTFLGSWLDEVTELIQGERE